jgi:hypothetical protein
MAILPNLWLAELLSRVPLYHAATLFATASRPASTPHSRISEDLNSRVRYSCCPHDPSFTHMTAAAMAKKKDNLGMHPLRVCLVNLLQKGIED